MVQTTTTVNFGEVNIGSSATRSFVVSNTSDQPISLRDVVSSDLGFTVSIQLNDYELSPGESTTFALSMDTTSESDHRGAISIINSAGSLLFVVPVSGSVVTAAASPTDDLLIVDDGDPWFDAGGFRPHARGGYAGALHFSAAGDGNTASWTISELPAGRYRVSTTWPPAPNRATNATYTVLDGTQVLAAVAVDQGGVPGDLYEDGVYWEDLGEIHVVSSGTLVVQLTDLGADHYVVADAIRVERIYSTSPPEIELSDGTTEIINDTTIVDFGTVAVGDTLSKTLTITNTGGDGLMLGPIWTPAGVTLVRGFGTTKLFAGQSTNFAIAIDTSIAGPIAATLQLGSNDADESLFSVRGFVIEKSTPTQGCATFVPHVAPPWADLGPSLWDWVPCRATLGICCLCYLLFILRLGLKANGPTHTRACPRPRFRGSNATCAEPLLAYSSASRQSARWYSPPLSTSGPFQFRILQRLDQRLALLGQEA